MMNELPSLASALMGNSSPIINVAMWKALPETETAWRFAGIASDETPDYEGDSILRKALDISYAQKRGYVNWDHSREPGDQLGHLTDIKVLDGQGKEMKELEGLFEIPLNKSASVFVKGELYKHVPKAQEVYNLLKSAPPGKGPGLSLDGSMARDTDNGNVVKAFVRGVAITAQPAHPLTMARLAKSLHAYEILGDKVPADAIEAIASAVVERLQKSTGHDPQRLTRNEAILFVLEKQPSWTYEKAARVVSQTFTNRANGS